MIAVYLVECLPGIGLMILLWLRFQRKSLALDVYKRQTLNGLRFLRVENDNFHGVLFFMQRLIQLTILRFEKVWLFIFWRTLRE